MLDSLQRPRAIHVKGKMLQFGGSATADRKNIICKCLQRMRAYCKVVVHVAMAEFPNYEICAKWRVFGEELVEACCKAGLSEDDMPSDAKDCLQGLAAFFGVNIQDLLKQYLWHVPSVVTEMKKQSVSQRDMTIAWAKSVSTNAAHKIALSYLVARFVVYTASTARVEQNFSALKRVFGEHRLSCGQDKESRLAIMALERPASAHTHDADATVLRAQDFLAGTINCTF